MKKLGFGLMRLPLTDPNDFGSVDQETFVKMADAFLANGFTYFDTAYAYHMGKSEVAFREAVAKRYPRDAYTITDKLPMFLIKNAEQILTIFEEQLERCGVTYFDYYLLHALGKPTYLVSEETGAFEFVAEKKREGKIRHIGLSFHDKAELLDEILTKHPEMDYVQLQINYVDWDDATIEAEKCHEIAVKHGKSVIVMEPIKGGVLADVPEEAKTLFEEYAPNLSAASWAVRFAASKENVIMVLSGMSNEAQLEDNMSYMKAFEPLNSEEEAIIEKVAQIIKASIAISCTGCRYCIDGCPKNIAIPEYFAIYNNMKRFGQKQNMIASVYYSNLAQRHGKASECIGCGQCEDHCPQHLPIMAHLKTIAAQMEN